MRWTVAELRWRNHTVIAGVSLGRSQKGNQPWSSCCSFIQLNQTSSNQTSFAWSFGTWDLRLSCLSHVDPLRRTGSGDPAPSVRRIAGSPDHARRSRGREWLKEVDLAGLPQGERQRRLDIFLLKSHPRIWNTPNHL